MAQILASHIFSAEFRLTYLRLIFRLSLIFCSAAWNADAVYEKAVRLSNAWIVTKRNKVLSRFYTVRKNI